MIRNSLARIGAAGAALAASGAALAQEVDVTSAVSTIESGTAAVAAIGGAALVVLAGAVVFKLVRRAM